MLCSKNRIKNESTLRLRRDGVESMLFNQIVFKVNQCWISDVTVRNQFLSSRLALTSHQFWAWLRIQIHIVSIKFYSNIINAESQSWLSRIIFFLQEFHCNWIKHWLFLNTTWWKRYDFEFEVRLRIDYLSMQVLKTRIDSWKPHLRFSIGHIVSTLSEYWGFKRFSIG